MSVNFWQQKWKSCLLVSVYEFHQEQPPQIALFTCMHHFLGKVNLLFNCWLLMMYSSDWLSLCLFPMHCCLQDSTMYWHSTQTYRLFIKRHVHTICSGFYIYWEFGKKSSLTMFQRWLLIIIFNFCNYPKGDCNALKMTLYNHTIKCIHNIS